MYYGNKQLDLNNYIMDQQLLGPVWVLAMTLAILRFLMTLFNLIREISALYLN